MQLNRGTGNPYREWIDEYSNEELTAAVDDLLSLLDEYAGGTDDKTRAEMTREFCECARLEYKFWDYAYRGYNTSVF